MTQETFYVHACTHTYTFTHKHTYTYSQIPRSHTHTITYPPTHTHTFKPSRGYLGCAISRMTFAGKSATLTRRFSSFTVDPRTIEAILAYKTHAHNTYTVSP